MGTDFSAEDVERSVGSALGAVCRVHDEVSSTNDVAAAWARDGAPEGSVVIADRQTAGRGRRGRTWLSEPGGALLFSIVLRPTLDARAGLLPIALGVGCAEGIESFGIEPRIKWPNDIVVEDRKIAGILVETTSSAGGSGAAIGGIGINYDWAPDELVEPTALIPTSVAAECVLAGRPTPSRLSILTQVLDALATTYALLKDRPDDVVARARSRSALLGHRVQVHLSEGSSFTGDAVDLAPDGGLIVRDETGERIVRSGDVTSVRPG